MENQNPVSNQMPSSRKPLVGILILAIVILGVIWFVFSPKEYTPPQLVFPSSTFPPSETPTASPGPGIVSAYLDAPFRVIAYLKNPKASYYLVVATERVATINDGNDEMCGSLYTSPTCYFFIEPAYVYQAPERKFVGKLEREGGLLPESIVFKSADIVEFQTGDGDAGWSSESSWQLNVKTGEFKLLKTIDTSSQE